MQQVYVKFQDADQVSRFVNIIDRLDGTFDLESEVRTVDAKSVIGVFALDFSKPLQLKYDSEDATVMDRLAPFLLEQPA